MAEPLKINGMRVSEVERGDIDWTKVHTLRRYTGALGGTLRVESRSTTRPINRLITSPA